MIGKAMIEIPPKFKDQEPVHPGNKDRSHYRNTDGLAEDVKHYEEWMRQRALESIGQVHPQVDLQKEHWTALDGLRSAPCNAPSKRTGRS